MWENIQTTGTAILSMVVVLGIMILVHEWGHFIAARRFGVRVEIFSIGFGPRLWGRKRGDTDYRVSALPLGGYVKMAGDNPIEERSGAPDEFLSKPRWQRAIIAVAGPVMNIITAYLLLVLLFGVIGLPYPAYLDSPAEIAAVGRNTSAARRGIEKGDRIADVNGVEVKTWKEVLTVLKNVPAGNEVSVKLERGGSLYTVEVARTADFDFSAALGYPHDPVTVESAERGKPAASMGMRAGDKIASINGEPVVSWLQCLAVISGSKGQPIDIGLRRGEEALTIRVTPIPGRAARGEPPWMVGFRPVRIQNFERLSLLESVSEAGVHGAQASMLIVQVVGQLFTGKVSLREMQGVVGISVEAGRAARQGLPRFVELMALIGFNLAILNLLPIPILDGGHILMLAIEGIRGRDLSLKFKERFVQVGMVFLLVIFAIVMYNDVLRLLPGR